MNSYDLRLQVVVGQSASGKSRMVESCLALKILVVALYIYFGRRSLPAPCVVCMLTVRWASTRVRFAA